MDRCLLQAHSLQNQVATHQHTLPISTPEPSKLEIPSRFSKLRPEQDSCGKKNDQSADTEMCPCRRINEILNPTKRALKEETVQAQNNSVYQMNVVAVVPEP
jgi:hypothetical protein